MSKTFRYKTDKTKRFVRRARRAMRYQFNQRKYKEYDNEYV